MALDGAFLHCIAEELNPLIGTRIDKIYQPGRDELVLSFRGKGGAVRVLFSVSADAISAVNFVKFSLSSSFFWTIS